MERSHYKYARLEMEAAKHQDYCLFKISRPEHNRVVAIMQRISECDNPCLMSLEDFVNSRHELSKVQIKKSSYKVMLQQLWTELTCFTLSTYKSNKIKSFYDMLEPKNILFDQRSLRVRLSREAILLKALGVEKMPLSIENKIAFGLTPRPVDFFPSPYQLLDNYHPNSSDTP